MATAAPLAGASAPLDERQPLLPSTDNRGYQNRDQLEPIDIVTVQVYEDTPLANGPSVQVSEAKPDRRTRRMALYLLLGLLCAILLVVVVKGILDADEVEVSTVRTCTCSRGTD